MGNAEQNLIETREENNNKLIRKQKESERRLDSNKRVVIDDV